jgi:hypothetical protein
LPVHYQADAAVSGRHDRHPARLPTDLSAGTFQDPHRASS